jgi:hypothetical protein
MVSIDRDFTFILVLMILCVAFGFSIALGIFDVDELSQETLDDICLQLTNESGTIAEVGVNGELICEIPSYDSTPNIIVKSNSDNDKGGS